MKDSEEISTEVIAHIASALSVSPESISEAHTITDLSQDSIQLFELLLAFERAYQIETSYDDIARLNTVGDIVQYVTRVKYSA